MAEGVLESIEKRYLLIAKEQKSCYATSYRTSSCGELTIEDIGKRVTLAGWARLVRDHGGAKFIDLSDREGCTQLIFEQETFRDLSLVDSIGREYVIQVKGLVRERPEDTEDFSSQTGEIEVLVDTLNVLSKPKIPPFELIEEKRRFLPTEEIRLRWRFLDLRRREMINNIKLRFLITKLARQFFWEKGFWEIETPYLAKSTPEGARDFVVPLRGIPGSFYALPQSPQLYKQLLMISGLDRYFQIAKCFREEDLREDRQPEFTQIDFEMSFVNVEEIIALIEELMKKIWKEIHSTDISFQQITFEEAVAKYGSDKPDLRYGMEICDLTEVVRNSDYLVFKNSVKRGSKIKCICVKSLYRRKFRAKDAQQLIKYVIDELGGKGLTWIIIENGRFLSIPKAIAEGFNEQIEDDVIKRMKCEDGDVLFFVADQEYRALYIMGELRKRVAKSYGLYSSKSWSFVWIIDPPYFERDLEGNILNKPAHHPFTAPKELSLEYLQLPRKEIVSQAYDLVINGEEIGGGSLRINEAKIQKKIFDLLGYSDKELEDNFGFLMKALEYGAPPHAGAAIGLDRLTAVIGRGKNIRDYIAFPKTKKFISLVDNSPCPLDEMQLDELGIVVLGER
ncbi:MAG: aspartate--tRNA ligase [Candidatus Heimdallarchaeota archaeon]